MKKLEIKIHVDKLQNFQVLKKNLKVQHKQKLHICLKVKQALVEIIEKGNSESKAMHFLQFTQQSKHLE